MNNAAVKIPGPRVNRELEGWQAALPELGQVFSHPLHLLSLFTNHAPRKLVFKFPEIFNEKMGLRWMEHNL